MDQNYGFYWTFYSSQDCFMPILQWMYISQYILFAIQYLRILTGYTVYYLSPVAQLLYSCPSKVMSGLEAL